jgi:peptidyl-prolyl cis-trans isomerase B (cyclophilin B)
MTKFQTTITVVFILIFGALFFFIQKFNSVSSTAPAAVTPTLQPIVTDTFQAKVNLTPGQNQQTAPQQSAQQQQQQSPLFGPINASVSATIKTSKGDIKVNLFGDKAEKTVRNFIEKAQKGYYRNLTFHRVEDWVIQGGDPRGDGSGGGQILTEPNDMPFVVGSIGVARGGDPRISNDSQFFITKTDASHLNEQYTNFGMVTKGMDVVNKIAIGDKILGITIEK